MIQNNTIFRCLFPRRQPHPPTQLLQPGNLPVLRDVLINQQTGRILPTIIQWMIGDIEPRYTEPPNQSTQTFLEVSLRGRFNPNKNPEELKSLAIEYINDNQLQYASEIGKHLCYRANDVPENDKHSYFNAACDIAIELTRHHDATHMYVRDITTLLTENNQTELINTINQSDRRPIFIDLGTVTIHRNELPEKLEDPVSFDELKPGDKIFVLCTEEWPDGRLGKIWHLFSEKTLIDLRRTKADKHPCNRKKIIGCKRVEISNSDTNSGI